MGNNCGCDWDGGDCCGYNGKQNQRKYCKLCKCSDPSYVDNGCRGHCGLPKYKGDGYCDDSNNNCACSYDGGDCCGKSGKKTQYKFCKDCVCRQPGKTSKPIGNTCTGRCGDGGVFKGDGYCDDGNNNCGCQYDGGDCCGKSGKNGNSKDKFKYCTSCACKDPKVNGGGVCAGYCAAGGIFKGDGYCDDANNNCGCQYDGGDCCGKSGQANQKNVLHRLRLQGP